MSSWDAEMVARIAERLEEEGKVKKVAVAAYDEVEKVELVKNAKALGVDEVLDWAGEGDAKIWDLKWKRLAVAVPGEKLTKRDVGIILDIDEDEEFEPEESELWKSLVSRVVSEGGVHFEVVESEAEKVRQVLSEEEVEMFHRDIFANAFGRNSGRMWDETSSYMLDNIVHHGFAGKQVDIVHQLTVNINWILRKAIVKPDHFDSLIEQDMLVLSKISPKPGAILKRSLKGFSVVHPFVLEKSNEFESKQIIAEYLWNKLSGIMTSDRFFHMLVYNCNLLRRSLAKRVAANNTSASFFAGLCARKPVLANAVDPLLLRLKHLHTGFVKAIAAIDDSHFASGCSKGSVSIVNWESGSATHVFSAHPGWAVTAIQALPTLQLIVTASTDSSCKTWSQSDLITTFSEHKDSVRALATVDLNSGEAAVLSGSDDGTILVWNPASLEVLFSFEEVHKGWCLGVDGYYDAILGKLWVASCADDGSIYVWRELDPAAGSIATEPYSINHHFNQVTSVCFGDTYETLCSGSADRSVCVWDIPPLVSEREPNLRLALPAHEAEVRCLAVQGSVLIAGCADNTLHVWDLTSGERLQELRGHADVVNALAVLSVEYLSHPLSSPKHSGEQSIQMEQKRPLSIILASGSDDKAVLLWDVSCEPSVPVGTNNEDSTQDALNENEIVLTSDVDPGLFSVTAMHVSGESLYLGCSNGCIISYSITSDMLAGTMNKHTRSVEALVSNSKFLVSGSQDYSVLVWNRETFTCVHELTSHLSGVTALSINEDLVISASKDKKVIVWDVERGVSNHVLRGHDGQVNFLSEIHGLSLMDIPAIVLSCSNDKTIRAWDLNAGMEIRILTGHEEAVQQAHFFGYNSGKQLCISFGNDKTVRIWDIVWGTQLRIIMTADSLITGFAFDSQFQQVFTSTQDGVVMAHDVEGSLLFKYSTSNHHGVTQCITALTLLEPHSENPILACCTSPDKAVLFFETSSAQLQNGESMHPFMSTHLTLGPFDNPKLSGKVTGIASPGGSSPDKPGVLCLSFSVRGFALLDLYLGPTTS